MTVAELIADLQKYPPDTSVRAAMADEFRRYAVEIGGTQRVLTEGVPYIEIWAEL